MKQNWYLIVLRYYIETPTIKYIEDCTEEEVLEKINPITDAEDFHTISKVIFFNEDNLLNKDNMWYLVKGAFINIEWGSFYSEDLIYNTLQLYSDLHRNDDFNEPFIATGYKSISNAIGGIEIQINDSGDVARFKFGNDEIPSDWIKIKYNEIGHPYCIFRSEKEFLSDFTRYKK